MSEMQIVRKVELPLGLATIFGGIRTSTVNVVATATIAPLANVKTLGYPIINTNVYGFSGTLGAAIVVALLTLFMDGILAFVQRAVTPRGIKIRAGAKPGRGRFFAIRTPREGQVT
jgi:osmoprotectant transport system permease protein